MKSINSASSQEAMKSAEPPSLLALEAVALVLKGSTRQPSAQAIDILARMMANRARRTMLADQSDQTKANPPASFKP